MIVNRIVDKLAWPMVMLIPHIQLMNGYTDMVIINPTNVFTSASTKLSSLVWFISGFA